jgi:predicted DsbA family dithiol-disulfide isomerase
LATPGCAEAAGLDSAETQRIPESDDFGQAVIDEEHAYQRAGVTAVPGFIVNEKYLISGAQDTGTLVEAFRNIAREQYE